MDLERTKDVLNIKSGAYRPLKGFLREADFVSVLKHMRLKSGEIWSIPIVLDVDKETAEKINGKEKAVLIGPDGKKLGFLKKPEAFRFDKDFFAKQVFKTSSLEHPGAAKVYAMKNFLLGGEVELTRDLGRELCGKAFKKPDETRSYFKKRGWSAVAAFQTRNIPHRGHEFLQRKALEFADGVLVHPVIGRKKPGDFLDEIIIESYKVMLKKNFPPGKALLSALPLEMRYAGPREAVFHAIIRRNFGCTHFIVGRDHAGVGDFYGPFDAQKIFDTLDRRELGIEILKFPEVVFDSAKDDHCFIDESAEKSRINFSGTKLREYLSKKEMPPEYILRPEVYEFLIKRKKIFVEDE